MPSRSEIFRFAPNFDARARSTALRVRQSLHTGSSLSALLAGQSVLHSNFMTLMEKIREYAESNRPFRLQLSDTRILEVKGRDWISAHPSRAVAPGYIPKTPSGGQCGDNMSITP
jgi:hypothetical protein